MSDDLKAYEAYFGALNQRVQDGLRQADDAWETYNKVCGKLGAVLQFTQAEQLWAAEVGGAAKLLDVVTLDVINGKRKVGYNAQLEDFEIESLPGDLKRLVLQPAAPGFALIPITGGEGGTVDGLLPLVWAGVAVSVVQAAAVYLVVAESTDALKVIAQKRTEKTIAETAGSYSKLVAEGKATPEQAKQLTDSLYTGSVELAKAAPPVPPEDTTGGKIKSVTSTIEKVAWIALGGVVLYGAFRIGSTLLEQRGAKAARGPYRSNPPRLTEAQSRKRVAELKKRGCKVEYHRLPDGSTAVLKKCP